MPLFTVESARLAGLKSAALRKQARDNPPPPPIIPLPEPSTTEEDTFHSRRLDRVRRQLDSVDAAIQTEANRKEPDGQRLNWLASAQERLAEQERVLAGRPLPGSRRPGPEKGSRQRGGMLGGIEPGPAPSPQPTITAPVQVVTQAAAAPAQVAPVQPAAVVTPARVPQPDPPPTPQEDWTI